MEAVENNGEAFIRLGTESTCKFLLQSKEKKLEIINWGWGEPYVRKKIPNSNRWTHNQRQGLGLTSEVWQMIVYL